MKNAPLRHAVEYALYRVAKAAILSLPHPTVRRLGYRFGRLSYRLAGSKRRIALKNIALALPEKTAAERERIARGCFEHYGSHFLEILSLTRFTLAEASALFEIEGWEHVEALGERGYFLTGGHYGHWELAVYPLTERIDDFRGVARPPDNPWVARDLRAIRERFGVGVIDKKGAGFRMIKAHRQGAKVGIIIDQHVRPSAGIQVPFLGHPAWTSPTLAFLSIRTGAPVIHFTCVPLAGGRYRIRLRPAIEPAGEGPEAEAALTRRYLEEVERDIRRQPELWLWMHRRWRD